MKTLLKLLLISGFLTIIGCDKKPDMPVCVSPVEDATNIKDSVVVLSWTCTDPNGDKLLFDIYLSDNGILTENNKIVKATDKFSCEIRDLKDNTKYYWQVIAADPKGKFSTNFSSFTTGKIQQ